ncbi:MAG: RNA-binding protein [Nitrospirota bacterium]|nr:RNA-binding protein [Nitrospirota bacterium]
MGNRLYVGNLPFSIQDDSLSALFAEVGEVTRASVVTDPATGRSRGFGFVEMATEALAESAIQSMNGRDMSGRPLRVDMARPKPERRSGPGGPRRSGPGGPGGSGGYRRSPQA